jgi:hypothetical protein
MNQREFEIRYRYPLLWLNRAERHLYSARIIYKEIKKLLSKKSARNDNFDQKYRSLSETYLFLIGIAMENLIKGLIISKEPVIKDLTELKSKYGWNDKHDLSSMIMKNFNFLDKDEKDTISRVEEYVKWAGKYPLTKKAMPINGVDYNLKDKDKENIEKLFFDIKLHITNNWRKTENEYFQWIQPEK